MSGDVQPRKRKDKKKKKDELGVEDTGLRGTAAVFGEGDVFMHSYHDHGTGGHWCAKVIFFALLAVLVTLIGLIILENRGLSELEANAVESRYSGVLEGWLEDAPDDDHHDEHTLELNHHDDHDDVHDLDDGIEDDDEDEYDNFYENDQDIEEHGDDEEHDDDEDHEQDDEDDQEQYDEDDEEQDDEDDQQDDEDDQQDDEDDQQDDEDDQEHDDEDDQEQDIKPADDEDEDEIPSHRKYVKDDDEDETENDDDGENESSEFDENADENNDESLESEDDDDTDRNDNDDEQDDEDDEHEEDEDDSGIELEKIEKEASEEEEPISVELPVLPEEDDEDEQHDDDESKEESPEDEVVDKDDYLEADEEPPSIVERITAPAGKPFVEVEDEVASETPPDTLEEEEEYEKHQEELRREEEQASHMWLKLVVGGALLAATHAVVRRATAPRDVPEHEESVREETPVVDRRMTLIAEEPSEPVIPKRILQESSKPVVEEVKKVVPIVHSPPQKQPSEEDDEDQDEPEEVDEEIEEIENAKKEEEKELFSEEDEEAEEEEEEIVEEKKVTPIQITPVVKKPPEPEVEPEPEEDEEVPDDVEIIDDEQIEEEEEDEEDISDVDDAELLTRLEAKYGRLPEPERPGQKYKDGGNSIEDEWPGEPNDPYWRNQLDSAEEEVRQGAWTSAEERVNAAELRDSARARYIAALALDRAAEARRDNRLLSRAVAAYLHLLKMNERLSDKKLLSVTARTLDRIQFRGTYLSAEPVYRLLIRRFPNEPQYRNNLTISFLMANRADLAEDVLKETLSLWPDDRVALAHYGFVLKTHFNRLEEAVTVLHKALALDKGPACEPRFYYHLGDALLLLGRYEKAQEVHKRAAKFGHFLSPAQRSLYNVPRLKGRPWWNIEDTPYIKLARSLENSWKDILKEGEAAKALYEKEKEGLKERGDWTQLDLFVRGQEIPGRCKRAPVTCSVVKNEAAAVGCRRGQVKFSAMQPGTHVRPHVGPTNCRLRMHLGLSNTKNTFIRVDQETRQWQEGKVLLFDDSFEHEVWHNGTGPRLVLIVDVWHPDLTPAERRQLPAI